MVFIFILYLYLKSRMLFPLKKKDSVVFPGHQSRIIPRHLILNLKRRMSCTSFYKYELREQCMSLYILNNNTHNVRPAGCLLMEEELTMQNVRADRYTRTSCLMKRTENNSLWCTRPYLCSTHLYLCTEQLCHHIC